MKNLVSISVLCLVFLFACKNEVKTTLNANVIVDQAIVKAGGELFEASTITFTFRDKKFLAKRNHGNFELVRVFKDSTNTIKDELTNTGFTRYVNNNRVQVADSMATRYAAAVNSVHYFSVLPYGLNAPAVNKTYLDSVEIKGKKYHKIKVTFNEDGGGEDFEDVFVYWVNIENNTVDYLAYSYAEKQGFGYRFREAFNVRTVNGLQFADYNNYKPETEVENVMQLDSLYEANRLTLLSKIELKNIVVDKHK